MSTRQGVRRRTARLVLAATLAVALVVGTGVTAASGTWLASSPVSMVSVASDGSQDIYGARNGAVSDDGRYVAFATNSSLVSIDTVDDTKDIYLRDTETGTTTLISANAAGTAAGNGRSGPESWDPQEGGPVMSADGRYIAFQSYASDLIAGDTNDDADIFVYDMDDGSMERVSLTDADAEANESSYNPAITSDGRYVAFESDEELVAADTNNDRDIYVRDTTSGTTTLVSVADDESISDNDCEHPAISDDGQTIAFESRDDDLVVGDTNSEQDVFVRDQDAGTTERVSVSSGGTESDSHSEYSSLTSDGRYVAFASWAGNLSTDDTAGEWTRDVFWHDRQTGETLLVSAPRDGGAIANRGSNDPHISKDGRYVAFSSGKDHVVGDTNGLADAYVFDAVTGRYYLVSVADDGSLGNDNSRRPIFSANGMFITFDSLAANLVPDDNNRGYGNPPSHSGSYGRDVFVRAFGPMLDPGVMRYAGADRYATAIAVSQSAWPDDSVDTVVIATGADWPDALSGSALAGTVGGPILLTTMDALPTTVKTEIDRLGAENAYVVGGAGVVSSAVMAELDAILDGTVTRLAGQTRYGTSRAIADEVIAQQMGFFDGTGIVTTGGNFADALAGAPLGAGLGWPVLLANPTTGDVYMPPAMTDAVILGGPGAVPVAGETALKSALGDAMVTRIGGATRYETAAMTAEYGVDNGLLWNGVGLATGELFPDGLTGGAALGSQRTVMLLTTTGNLAPATGVALDDNKSDIKAVQIIGGPGAVSPAVENQVKSILGL